MTCDGSSLTCGLNRIVPVTLFAPVPGGENLNWLERKAACCLAANIIRSSSCLSKLSI